MADRYWVGGSGIWSKTTPEFWSTVSGGSGGASVPTINDAVIFDGNSSAGNVTLFEDVVCLSVSNLNSLITFTFNGNFLTVGSQKITVRTSGTLFTIPTDWNNASNNIYLIGAGGGGGGSSYGNTVSNRAGGGGGGGGGFLAITNQSYNAGNSIEYAIGTGGTPGSGGSGNTVTAGTGGATFWNTIGGGGGVFATGGTGGSSTGNTPTSAGGVGGTGGTGGIAYTGGAGGLGGTRTDGGATGGGGGGGAAGPNGNGGAGGRGAITPVPANNRGGGGGGNGGGTAGTNSSDAGSSDGAGGNNSVGSGGGLSKTLTGKGNAGTSGGGGSGGFGTGVAGGNGGVGNEILGVLGSGGGSGGSTNLSNSTGIPGSFGGGGGGAGNQNSTVVFNGRTGRNGAIIIVYTPLPPTYAVGGDDVANYVNTTSGQVIDVTANHGLGGLGVVTRASLTGRLDLSFVIATDMQYPTINVSAIPNYIAGKSDVTITVNDGVYLYGYSFRTYNASVPVSSPLSATMNIIGGTAGDTIKLVNNGFILGAGGDGSGAISGQTVNCCCTFSYQWNTAPSTPGQAALAITYPLTLVNNGYIAGGGGGGAAVPGNQFYNYSLMGGGGGAGGGIGIDQIGAASTRAVPPNVGNNGTSQSAQYGPCACQTSNFISGGGGGFVLPGVGGLAQTGASSIGQGGGSGGAGSAYDRLSTTRAFNNNGGTANGQPPNYTRFTNTIQSGGGGGWGATGGTSVSENTNFDVGAPGGNSIITNGNAITTVTAGTQYGALTTNTTTYVTTLSSSETTTAIQIPGIATFTDVIIIVPAGVTLRSDDPAFPALFIENFSFEPILRVKIIVNGAILGKGGAGGNEVSGPQQGGEAIRISAFSVDVAGSITVDCTYGYVAGGGGGGGYAVWNPLATYYVYGGGGAGGGNSGYVGFSQNVALGATTVGASGSNGTTALVGSTEYISGGGGGLIVPGTSVSLGTKTTAAAFPGIGGSGGGSGAARKSSTVSTVFENDGGGFNNDGGTQPNGLARVSGGGGGGWGANGGTGKQQISAIQAGALGGSAINTELSIAVYVINPTNLAGGIF